MVTSVWRTTRTYVVATWVTVILILKPEIGYSWTTRRSPKKGRPTWQRKQGRQKLGVLLKLLPADKTNGINEQDSLQDWDHFAINAGCPKFLFTEEHFERRNNIDRETVIGILVPFVSPLVAFLSYDFVACSFHDVIDFVANNNWIAVDGGEYQAQSMTLTINGVVLPAISVLFATLTSTTIMTLRDRQSTIRSCINAEAGELRALEYLITAHSIGSGVRSMCRQYMLQYTSRIIAESQPTYRNPLASGNNLPSPQHGMDSELNGLLGLLTRLEGMPNLLREQCFQAVLRLRQSRQRRLTAMQSTYPLLHYGILAILACGEMAGFLIEGNQELLVFLNAVQLKLLWSMLIATIVACFMVFYDLLNPFSGSYQVTAAVDQLHTIRLGLRAQTQLLSIRDKEVSQGPRDNENKKEESRLLA